MTNAGMVILLMKENLEEKQRRMIWKKEKRHEKGCLLHRISGKEGLWVIVEGKLPKLTVRRDDSNEYYICERTSIISTIHFIPLNSIRRR